MFDSQIFMQLQKNEDKIKECNKILKDGSYIYLLKKMKKEFQALKEQYAKKDEKLKDIKEKYIEIRKGIKEEKKILEELNETLYNKSGSDLNLIKSTQLNIAKHSGILYNLENERDGLLKQEERIKGEKEDYRIKLYNTKENFYSYKEKCNNKINNAKKALNQAENYIVKLESSIPKEYLLIYNKIKQNKGIAVAELENGTCSHCRMKASAITVDKIYRGEDVVLCNNCGRILHYKSVKELKEAK